MAKDPNILMDHILESIAFVESYTKGLDKEAFFKNHQVQDAVMKRLEVIGEACKNLPSELRLAHSNIPWRDIGDMRDFLIHEYFGVDMDLVWETVEKDIPMLKQSIQRLRD